jgi:hypothetical protein
MKTIFSNKKTRDESPGNYKELAGVAGYISGACSVYIEDMDMAYEKALLMAKDKASKFFYMREGAERYNKVYSGLIEAVYTKYTAKFRDKNTG